MMSISLSKASRMMGGKGAKVIRDGKVKRKEKRLGTRHYPKHGILSTRRSRSKHRKGFKMMKGDMAHESHVAEEKDGSLYVVINAGGTRVRVNPIRRMEDGRVMLMGTYMKRPIIVTLRPGGAQEVMP